MKIKGVASIVAVHADGSTELLVDNACNDICWPSFRRCFIHDNTLSMPGMRDAALELAGGVGRWRLFYGSRDIKPTPLNAWYAADGTINSEINYPTYTTGALVTDPDRLTIRGTLPAPVGGPRTIQVIGIDLEGSSYPTMSSVVGGHLTILRLTTPCTQAESTTLIITYDLYFYPDVGTVDGRINQQNYTLMRAMFKSACATPNAYRDFTSVRDISFTPFELPDLTSFGLTTVQTYGNVAALELTSDGMLLNDPAKVVTANAITYNTTYATTVSQGMFIKYTFLIGGSYLQNNANYRLQAAWYQSARGAGDTNPVQNVYGQRNTPPGPSQDSTSNNTATMTGNLAFNVSGWVDPKLQRMVRVDIVDSGAVGVATYRLSVMDFNAGFVGNRWVARTALLPQTLYPTGYFKKAPNEDIYETLTQSILGSISYRSDGDRLVLAASCLRTMPGVSVYNVVTGQRTVFNTANGLSTTAVSDGEYSGGWFYVTCANTGLWRISTNLTTVEQVPSPTGTDQAYQICKKNDGSGTIWVLFNGGLCKLANPNAALGALTWTTHNSTVGSPLFTYVGITDNKWSNVMAMIVDPDNLAADQFLFVTGTLAGNDASGNYKRGYVWWDTVTGIATNPSTNGADIFNISSESWTPTKLLQLSDRIRCVGGRWLAPHTDTTYIDDSAYSFGYGSSNMMAVRLTMRTAERFIPAVINGISGALTCSAHASSSTVPSMFIRATTLQGIVANTTLDTGSANVEFPLRVGANSFATNMETTAVGAGNLSLPLAYLPASNIIFTMETNPNCYGATPFMLPPTHNKYSQYKGAFWRDYGWDGTNWVLGNTTAKLTHAGVTTVDVLDNLALGFTNGVSGTSFVASEWFMFAVGAGVFKDNGVTYTASISYSLDPTQVLPITGNVPQTAMGLLTDEPVTFSLLNASRSTTGLTDTGVGTHCIQNRGLVWSRSLSATATTSRLISDQLIPASTQFDLRFKWADIGDNNTGVDQYYGLGTGTGTYTDGIHFRHNRDTSTLTVYNNTALLATVAAPTINGVCQIVRDASNMVTAYYNGVALHAPVSTTSQFVIMADARQHSTGQGWWDMLLTYTEARRVHRISAGPGLGCLHPKFSALTYSPTVGDVSVLVGSPTPLAMILDYTTAGVPLAGTGRVKVCPGAGWLVFHDSEPANVLSGSAVGHFILNNA